MNKPELIKYIDKLEKSLEKLKKENESILKSNYTQRRNLIKLAEEAGSECAIYKHRCIRFQEEVEKYKKQLERYKKNEVHTHTGNKNSRK